jgi:hypothetical protein
MLPDLLPDPFGERARIPLTKHMQLLGARFQFASNSRELMRLVDSAYASLPQHRLSAAVPRARVTLLLRSGRPSYSRGRPRPPSFDMLSGAGFLGGATTSSNFVILSPQERSALVVVSPQMLRFAYHTRYELIEFAVFTLAARAQGLVSLHAACVGRGGRGVLLMGPAGAGKSTLALQCLLRGFDFLSEDSVFAAPETMLATGVANFLHVRADSLRWLEGAGDVAAIRKSPVIKRRSGVRKFELDLRGTRYRLAASPLKIDSLVFLSAEHPGNGPLLRPLRKSEAMTRLAIAQAYAANQPQWPRFVRQASGIDSFELRRGSHPLEAVEVLRALLARRSR